MSTRPWELREPSAELLNGFRSSCDGPGGCIEARKRSAGSAVQQRGRSLTARTCRSSSALQQTTPCLGRWSPGSSSALQQTERIEAAITRFFTERSLAGELESAGVELRRVGRTNGGEWACPCPLCGGRDRLRVWLTPRTGPARAWCRQCGRCGDALAWATWLDGRDPTVRGSVAATLRAAGYLPERRRSS